MTPDNDTNPWTAVTDAMNFAVRHADGSVRFIVPIRDYAPEAHA